MTDFGQFAGRFHPLLVHFPIAFLLLAGLLEAAAWRRRSPGAGAPWQAAAVTPLLALAALSAAAAAGAGYLLGATGGYGGTSFDRHQLLGFALAGIALLTTGASWLRDRHGAPWVIAVRSLLVATLLVVTITAHLGATLAHGEDYLLAHAPGPLRQLLAFGSSPGTVRAPAFDQAVVYTDLVRPILHDHCLPCHGGTKSEGGLRLDTPDHIRKGGDGGPVITPGRAAASELVRRVWLPAAHEDVMPPKGRRTIRPIDAGILRWWVDKGASFDAKLADAEVPADLVPALEATFGQISRGGPSLPRVSLDAPHEATLAAIRSQGLAIEPIADSSPFLQVRVAASTGVSDDERLTTLKPVARHVVWLDLSGSGISDAVYTTIAELPHLTRLNVSRTATTDAGLARLAPLRHLESLNVYGTTVSDAGLARLTDLASLRRLYVWGTAVTPGGAERLRAALPRLEIVLESQAPSDAEKATPKTVRSGGAAL